MENENRVLGVIKIAFSLNAIELPTVYVATQVDGIPMLTGSGFSCVVIL